MTLSRRAFLGTTAAFAQTPASKPNIIFILADDLGIAGLSCYGGQRAPTPNIDALAQGGTRFTNAYTAPLCGPSRMLIMTGRYAFRTGATNQDATGEIKPDRETFIPKMLKSAGYASASIGKWGQLPLGPAAFGFDEHFFIKGSGVYWSSQGNKAQYAVNGKAAKPSEKEYVPDLMHGFLVDFIQRHRNRPFFAYYSMSHVHGEILPTPDSAPDSKDHYADNLRYMDKLVGKLTAELDRLNLRRNTLIVFIGDNGTAENYAAEAPINGRRVSGQKGSMLEGGAHVPLIVNWPGTTPAGKVSTNLTDSTDFLPTFAELAGAAPPKDTVIDGRSMAAQLRGKPGRHRDWIFIQLARMWYVRDSQWKLNQAGQLFDMRKAPFEEPAITNDAARQRLQAVLDKLNPGGGILDHGTGDGRHAGRAEKKKKKAQN